MTAIYGHRGAKGERPENTIAAFLHAASLGLAGVECDVSLTRDLVPVMHHDPEISGAGLIRDLSLAELHWLAPDIPTLAQALHALRAVPEFEWLIEIKTFPEAPDKSASPGTMAAAVIEVLQNAGKLHQACILAFDWRVLAAAAQCASVRLVCLTEPATEQARNIWWGAGITAAATPDAVAQANVYGWAPFRATLTEDQMNHAHQLGLKIFPWTINDPADFQFLAPIVDGIITDFPSRMLRGVNNVVSAPDLRYL